METGGVTIDGDGLLLLKAILEKPGEDTPRLVYADWLEESGCGDYAEFIRVQVALAVAEDRRKKEAVALRERQAGLMRRSNEWFYCPAAIDKYCLAVTEREYRELRRSPYPQQCRCVLVRRGFVESIQCEAATWLASGDFLLSLYPIRQVWLNSRGRNWIPRLGSDRDRGDWFYEVAGKQFQFPSAQRQVQLYKARWPGVKFDLVRPYRLYR